MSISINDMILLIASKVRLIAPLFARLVIGYVFVTSGWGKFQNLDSVISFFSQLGIPAPELQAPFVSGVELVAGLMVLVGFMTRWAALPLIGTMVVAIITAKLGEGVSLLSIFGFQEFNYIALLVWLFVAGAGLVSVDQFISKRFAGLEQQ